MKFYDAIGYVESVERPVENSTEGSGVWEDIVTERKLYGDVIRDTRALREGDKVNNDLTIGNRFSVVADGYANENFWSIKYVTWRGTRFHVVDVEAVERRLILTPGGVYNGPTPAIPSTP